MRESPYFQRFASVLPSETGQKSVRVAVVRAGAGYGCVRVVRISGITLHGQNVRSPHRAHLSHWQPFPFQVARSAP